MVSEMVVAGAGSDALLRLRVEVSAAPSSGSTRISLASFLCVGDHHGCRGDPSLRWR